MPRVASRSGVNVAGALPFEESGAFRRWVPISRLVGSDLRLPEGWEVVKSEEPFFVFFQCAFFTMTERESPSLGLGGQRERQRSRCR